MKNKYLCWIVDNYVVCLSVIFIWNLFEVVGKVHVGLLILNFLFVCLFVLFFETYPIPSCLCVARVFASKLLSLCNFNIRSIFMFICLFIYLFLMFTVCLNYIMIIINFFRFLVVCVWWRLGLLFVYIYIYLFREYLSGFLLLSRLRDYVITDSVRSMYVVCT